MKNAESIDRVHTHTHTHIHTHTSTLKNRKTKGITLIALVITIVILLILSGITIVSLTGENGILKRAQVAKDTTNKNQAAETMNLKITNIQISSYAEKQELPSLQYVADRLCEDNDMEYVLLESKKTASLDKIIVSDGKSIYTKLKEYPYEFEINSSLQLASINGVKVTKKEGTSNFVIYIDNKKVDVFPNKESGYNLLKVEADNGTNISFNEESWSFTVSNFTDINTVFTFYFENTVKKLLSLAKLDENKYNTLDDVLKDNDAINKILNIKESKEYLLVNNGNNKMFEKFSSEVCSNSEKFKLIVNTSAFSDMLEIQKFRNDMYDNYLITENILAQSQNAIKTMIESNNFKVSSTSSYDVNIYDGKAFLIGISQTGENTNQVIGYLINR